MPNLVVSTFSLENDRGSYLPSIDAVYLEKETGISWTINCGGSRAYFIRFGEIQDVDLTDQAADSHFMMKRVTTALFLSGLGLFTAKPTGRIIIKSIKGDELEVISHLDLRNPLENEKALDIKKEKFGDWIQFICTNTLFRRAADDLYMATCDMVESDFYIYRAMEWIQRAADIGWKELATDIGVSFKDIKKFKKQVNHDLGQRHGIESGLKKRASIDRRTLVADTLFAFCEARKRVDNKFAGISEKETASIICNATPLEAYR